MNNITRSMLSSFHRITNTFKTRWLSSKASSERSKSYHLLLAIPVTSFCLGTWQVQRLEWKKELIRELEAKTQRQPVPVPSDILTPSKLDEMEYRRVIVTGKFDHSQEILLGPRSLNREIKNRSGSLIGGKPESGFHIVTPFVLDSGERILVDRGWVPMNKKSADTRSEGQITDTVRLTGYVKKGEKRPSFAPKVNPDGFNWHYCDVDSFSRLLDTSPLLIEADALSSVPGGPTGGQLRASIRNEHMQYIITWYALSVATFVMYYQMRKNPAGMFRGGPIIRE